MKVIAKPIEMIAWFREDGTPKPANEFCVKYIEMLKYLIHQFLITLYENQE